MKLSKVIAPIAAAASSLIVYAIFKGKNSAGAAKVIPNAAKVASDAVVVQEKMFGGLTQSAIDNIVKNTYRGVKAVINGDTLEYWYKSNSGKSKNMARIVLDEAGKLKVFLGGGPYFYAKSPRFFFEKLLEAMGKNT